MRYSWTIGIIISASNFRHWSMLIRRETSMLISWQVSILTGNIRVGPSVLLIIITWSPELILSNWKLLMPMAFGMMRCSGWKSLFYRLPGKHGGLTPYILYVFVLLSIILSGWYVIESVCEMRCIYVRWNKLRQKRLIMLNYNSLLILLTSYWLR